MSKLASSPTYNDNEMSKLAPSPSSATETSISTNSSVSPMASKKYPTSMTETMEVSPSSSPPAENGMRDSLVADVPLPSPNVPPSPPISPPGPPEPNDDDKSPPPSPPESSPVVVPPSPDTPETSPPLPSPPPPSVSPPPPSPASPPPIISSPPPVSSQPAPVIAPPQQPPSSTSPEIPSPPAEKISPPSPFISPSPPSSTLPPPGNNIPPAPAAGSISNPTPRNDERPGESSHSTPSSINSNASPSHESSSDSSGRNSVTGIVVGVAVGGVVLAMLAVFFVILMKKKQKKKPSSLVGEYGIPPKMPRNYASPYPDRPNQNLTPIVSNLPRNFVGAQEPGGSKSSYSYEEMMKVTNGFSRENIIGEGGFGQVYKGVLFDGRKVAVKQLKVGSGQGEREFRAEVEIISRIHHRHLVSLVGYCISEQQRLLVYEFVANNTLEYHIHGNGILLDWPKRMRIAIGSARGLAYLHEDCQPKIIHRDIKSANILLDEVFEAKVADFGLAKLANDCNTHISTRVVGTFGYMAPEYAASGKLTDRSDVFSFGVVLLELITGRKPVDQSRPLGEESLVEWSRPLLVSALATGNLDDLVDPRLENNFLRTEMLRMIEAAIACIRHSAPNRPRMMQVLRSLDSDGNVPDLSNGVKFGQSTVYNSKEYSADIEALRRLAFEGDPYSSEYSQSGAHETGNFPYSRTHL